MVKSRTEVIIAISDADHVAEKAKCLLLFMSCFHIVCLLQFVVAGVYGVCIMFNLTEKQMQEPLIAMMKKYVLLYGTNWNVFFVVAVCGAIVFLSLTDEQLKEPLFSLMRKYLLLYSTNWNASFQTTFLCLALAHDVLQWLDKHESNLGKKIKYFRDIVFNGLVFPFTCFVTCMFWTVYLIDRELVFPQIYDQIVPWWLNHCVHTNIFIVIIIETILTRRRHPTHVKIERYMYSFVSVFYAVVYYSIFFFGGVWLYGVFGVMTWWQVCLYQCGIWFSTWVFYRMAFIINRIIHKEEDVTVACKDSKAANGDFESKETTFNGAKNDSNIKNGATEVAHDSNKSENNLNTNGTKDQIEVNGDNVNGNTNDLPSDNGNIENGKEWKSLGTNTINEEDENGALDQPFDKSWSTKYRTNRNQFDKSSL